MSRSSSRAKRGTPHGSARSLKGASQAAGVFAAAKTAFEPNAASHDLSDFEYALIILTYGFQRWVKHCMEAANVHGLTALDILVLHAVNHRARGRRLTEICMVLNIDDAHLVAYALKKLAAADLVLVTPKGRERHFDTTAAGEAACMAYRVVREQFLVPSLTWVAGRHDTVRDTAGFLRTMTALYDQAGRFATAATAGQPLAPPVHTKR
jgi:predicted MarR family transcription regulator